MDTALLLTKLHVPTQHPDWVSRPRLLEKISQGVSGQLTLISAPPGFGKTTLLSEWISVSRWPVAWISLDPGDNDFTRFLTYLVAALQRVDASIDNTSLNLSRSPQPIALEGLLTVLLNQIASFSRDFVLVLDDYHLIEESTVDQALDYILNHQPAHMHVIIATRADPGLQLARLRGQGQLVELRMADLRFTRNEAAALYARTLSLEISEDDLSKLVSRTEGWITGLQMAALSLQEREDFSAYIATFSGSHRYILDYLIEEVLQKQTEDVRKFLIQTSLLDRLNSSLCQAVTGRQDSQSILNYLEMSNLFIVPLDDERYWYRYHRLFADLLQSRLQDEFRSQVPGLHNTASQWYERHSFMPEAIDHALSAEDFQRACGLIDRVAEGYLIRSEISTLLRWIEKLPGTMLKEHPGLNFRYIWAQMLKRYRFDEVLAQLDQFQTDQEALMGRSAVLRAFIAVSRARYSEAGYYAEQALAWLDAQDGYFRNIAMWVLSISQITEQNYEEAARVMGELVQMSMVSGNIMIAVLAASQLARVRMRQGHLQLARSLFAQALEIARDSQGNWLPIAGEALMGLGDLYRELNELEAATETIQEGIELTRLWRDVAAMEGYISLARVKLSQANWSDSQAALDRGMELAKKYDAMDLDDRMVAMWQARLWAAQGLQEPLWEWAKALDLEDHRDIRLVREREPLEYHLITRESLVLIRLYLISNSFSKALQLIDTLLPVFQDLGRIETVIELHLLRAKAYAATGERDRAVEMLHEAVRMAAPCGFMRLFLDEGQVIKNLLHSLRSRSGSMDYIDRLLDSFGDVSSAKEIEAQPLVEPLSKRELDVLRLLPTNLTTPEIAAEMVIGVNTVRTHIKNIYSKLQVHKRTEAVRRAQELGLLS